MHPESIGKNLEFLLEGVRQTAEATAKAGAKAEAAADATGSIMGKVVSAGAAGVVTWATQAVLRANVSDEVFETEASRIERKNLERVTEEQR